MVDSRLPKQAAKDYNWAWDKDNKHLRNLLSQLAAEDSTMRNFYAARTLLEKTISKSALDTLEVLDGTLGDLGIELKLNVKPSTDLKRLAIAVEKKYTMIEHMDYAKWNWQSSKDFTDDLANYINIIDVCDIKQNSKRGS